MKLLDRDMGKLENSVSFRYLAAGALGRMLNFGDSFLCVDWYII